MYPCGKYVHMRVGQKRMLNPLRQCEPPDMNAVELRTHPRTVHIPSHQTIAPVPSTTLFIKIKCIESFTVALSMCVVFLWLFSDYFPFFCTIIHRKRHKESSAISSILIHKGMYFPVRVLFFSWTISGDFWQDFFFYCISGAGIFVWITLRLEFVHQKEVALSEFGSRQCLLTLSGCYHCNTNVGLSVPSCF